MHSMLCMSKQLIHSLHNIHTCNGMHVDAVNTILCMLKHVEDVKVILTFDIFDMLGKP